MILNSNRNNYRKCIDKTIDAFVKFLKLKNMKPNIKLFLNMDTDNLTSGYDIKNQFAFNNGFRVYVSWNVAIQPRGIGQQKLILKGEFNGFNLAERQ